MERTESDNEIMNYENKNRCCDFTSFSVSVYSYRVVMGYYQFEIVSNAVNIIHYYHSFVDTFHFKNIERWRFSMTYI